MDYLKYFDKYPLKNYAIGPSGSGIFQIQPYVTEWTGQFNPGVGIDLYSNSGHYFYPETGYDDTKYFSFCFDQQTNYWFGYSNDTVINIDFVSGSSKTNYTFSGKSPQMFHNSILKTGVVDAFCFYLKGDSNIYFKKSSENFGVERVAHSGNSIINRLHTVRKLEDFFYRYGVFYMDQAGDGVELISDKFPPMVNQNYMNFEYEPLGNMTLMRGLMVESNLPSGWFIPSDPLIGNSFETTPSGEGINLLTSGDNMLIGYFIYG